MGIILKMSIKIIDIKLPMDYNDFRLKNKQTIGKLNFLLGFWIS